MDEHRPAPASTAPTVAADPAAAAAVTAAAAAAAATTADFEYFGGEFPDDAPFVESLHGLAAPGSAAAFGEPAGTNEAEGGGDRDDGDGGGDDSGSTGGDLDALLSSLMGGGGGEVGGDFGFGSGGSEWAGCSDPAGGEIFFRINAAASFAALIAPEEQTAGIDLSEMDAQTAAEIVDALTPVELMQVGRIFTAGRADGRRWGQQQRHCALLSVSGCASTDSSFAH